jgi:outer membrane lipoprotein-sorting protein
MAGGALAQSDTPAPTKKPPVKTQIPATTAQGGAGDMLPPPEFIASGQPLDIDTHAVNPKAVNAADKAILDQVDGYFNAIRVMSGKFVQIGPDGQRTTGSFWVSKPGKMRFDYDPPSPLQVLADGTSVAVRNRKLATQSLYFIGQTPLRFLLADRIDLIEDSRVVAVGKEPAGISVVVDEKSNVGANARIQLLFPAPSFALRQWIITDAQGYDTTVMITSVDTTSRPPDKIFYIDQTKILK